MEEVEQAQSGEEALHAAAVVRVLGAWKFHRAYFRVTGGRRGLWPSGPGSWEVGHDAADVFRAESRARCAR